MRANAPILPTRLPARSPVRFGHHRHMLVVMPRLRASLVLRRLGTDGETAAVVAPLDSRRAADARRAA